MSPSSRGLGHCPFTAVTGVRIPLGMPIYMKLASLLTWANGIGVNMRNARVLITHELNITINETFTLNDLEIPDLLVLKKQLLLLQSGYPIEYIIGKAEFLDLEFIVDPNTLIPRSETAEIVKQIINNHKGVRTVLELGVGSGAISISIAKYLNCRVDGIDRSNLALDVANRNLQAQNLSNVKFWNSDWFEQVNNKYDLIISNPPYCDQNDPNLTSIEYEPIGALISEDRGYKDLRHIIENSGRYLNSDGWLYVEHGYNQSDEIIEIFKQNNYTEIDFIIDEYNIKRAVFGKKCT